MNRRLTDDEMEARARRNLAEPEGDVFSQEISVGGDANYDPAMDALEDIDTSPAPAEEPTDDELAELIEDPPPEIDAVLTDDEVTALEAALDESKPNLLDTIKRAVVRYGPGGELWQANRESFYAKKAEDARKAYAAKIAEENGRPVRRYRQGLDALTDVQRLARKAELERERYHKAKGAVRPHKSLAALSPEERKAHQNELAKLRQRRRRASKAE